MTEKFIISLTKRSETKLDKLILDNCPSNLSLSRTKIQDLINRKMIYDPKKQNALTLKTRTNDLKQIILYSDQHLQNLIEPQDLDVPIVFEDDYLVVFNKPANMVVHPVRSAQRGTLVNFLIYKYQDKLPITYDKFRPGIVHRLDKDTSGLITVAKTEFCADSLLKQFKSREVKKVYLALCVGNPLENLNKIITQPGINILEDNVLEVRTYIRRKKTNREMMEVNNHDGKLAISRFTVQTTYDLGFHKKLSLVTCQIETGRTHQIRVHARFIGCPVFGDNLYNLRKTENLDMVKTILSLRGDTSFRQMLHAHELSFVHPNSRKSLFFRGNLPLDFSNLLSDLDKYKTSHAFE